jgi:hypothetical protein
MGKFVLKTPVIKVNGQDISNYVHECTIETTRDEVEVTGFQAANKEILAGLGDATITLAVYQDFAAAAIDALFWPLSTSNTAFPVLVNPFVGANSPTNPQYAMQALLFTYNPIAGAVGDAAETPITLRNAASAGLTRATA